MLSIKNKIISRIYGHGRGWCFTPKHFLDIGSPEAIRINLHRLEKKSTIRRLSRGLYDYPKKHPTIGLLSPNPEKIVKALSIRSASHLQPSGAYAANLLGLSEQIPAKIVFRTDGPTKQKKIGNQVILFKHTAPRYVMEGKATGALILALKHLGEKQITRQHIEHLRRSLHKNFKGQLRRDRKYAPNWMQSKINYILEDPDDNIRNANQ
jgi:hypothetical protein